MKILSIYFLIFCALIATALPSFALSNAEKALYAASANTSNEFDCPSSVSAEVMSYAQNCMNDWGSFDSHKNVMRIQDDSPTLIQTYAPTDIDIIGFEVECNATSPSTDHIIVNCYAYTQNIFAASGQLKDAVKRARMMSCILQTYRDKLVASAAAEASQNPSSDPAATTPSLPTANVSDEEKLYIQLIQTQISAQNYDGALSTLDSLKADIIKDRTAPTPAAPVAKPAPNPGSTPAAAPVPAAG
jgi:hypothetical protein